MFLVDHDSSAIGFTAIGFTALETYVKSVYFSDSADLDEESIDDLIYCLRKMLVWDPAERTCLEDVKNEPWFASDED